jgi:hypothetical protein
MATFEADSGRGRRAVENHSGRKGAMMANKSTERRPAARDDTQREGTDLDRRYGRIGISAVAAAARYCGDTDDKQQKSSGKGQKREKVSA